MTPIFRIIHLPIVDSTSDYLKALGSADEFTVVTADEQTAGRGRRSNRWYSARGEGLWLSVLLRPPASAPRLTLISLLAAVAVAETLLDLGVEGVDIKWPNDILIAERKVAGILAESCGVGGSEDMRMVVGIGVNLGQGSFPAPLDETATSFRIATGQSIEVPLFRDRLLGRLGCWYERWRDGAVADVRARWLGLSAGAIGRRVAVRLDADSLSGTTSGIDEDGALLLRLDDGTLRTISSGEVTRLRAEERRQ